MIFQKGVQCEQSRKVCSQFRKECPEGDIQRLADQLKGVMASKKPKTKKDNCTTCGQEGHLNSNCWGRCPACLETGHRPGECLLSQNEIIRKENRRKRNLRLKRKRKLKRRIDKPQIIINLPDEEEVSNSNFGADSLSDEGTVIDTHDTEDSSGDSEEDEASEEVKRVREVIGDLSDKDIISAIEKK